MSSKNYYGLVFQFHQISVVINPKETNVGTKERSPKNGLASAKDLTVKLHEGRDSTYHRLDYMWMERFFFSLPDNLTKKVINYLVNYLIKKVSYNM